MTKFTPGTSGNPAGRPRGWAGLAREIRERTDDERVVAPCPPRRHGQLVLAVRGTSLQVRVAPALAAEVEAVAIGARVRMTGHVQPQGVLVAA